MHNRWGFLWIIVLSTTHNPFWEMFSDYSVHDFPSDELCMDDSVSAPRTETEVVVFSFLYWSSWSWGSWTMIQAQHKVRPFLSWNITHSDSLVRFYTGFQSYEILVAFFEYLGPSVNKLRYWCSKNKVSEKKGDGWSLILWINSLWHHATLLQLVQLKDSQVQLHFVAFL